MYGLAGATHTPGMPFLDGLDAAARQRDREARKARKEKQAHKPAKHVRNRQERRDPGHLNRSR